MDAIVLEQVSHRYGAVWALRDVSLALPMGKTIGLIGPDGVGKSTLLSLVAGVKRLQSGQVRVLGGDIARRGFRNELASRLAFMPQGLGRNLYPTLSVYENVDFFARLYGLDPAARGSRIERLLRATGLAPFPDRPAGKLSGGMKQKLSLCCALVHNPELLILDEPTTGVDPLSRRQFWALVDALRAELPGMTVVVATAYMEEAQRFEHLVALDAGNVLVSDATDAVMRRAGAQTLEQAYISLLPQDQADAPLDITPFEPRPGPPAIEASGLTRKFGSFVAVDRVSFRIERGEIFGFLGSNGCGKTTTMKMLTGLLDVSSGTAKLLGQPVNAGDMATRMKVGYMSQSFSLYEELTVRKNLELHARLYRMEGEAARQAVARALDEFELRDVAGIHPASLPLGMRQRLQLAAACLHSPEVLILDEPTSGVDPAARDMFWRHLLRLSRQERVTIFVSTHFMNEAQRCDRISFMHRGRVLAVGTPDALTESQHAATLEDAFVAYLEQADPEQTVEQAGQGAADLAGAAPPAAGGLAAWWRRTWAFAQRESLELRRDRMRLAFALLGPIVLLCIAAWSVSFDVENVRYAVLDRDQSLESRRLLEHFSGSRYFREDAPLASDAEITERLRGTPAKLIIDIPPGYGRDLLAGRGPKVGFYIDGAQPFTAENVRGYATGIMLEYTAGLMAASPLGGLALPARVESRFAYNQEFRSIYAITPGILMLAMILIPTMLTALGVVREKEMGSITNLYASPASVGQYLLGKQMPYVALAMLSYLTLVFLCIVLLRVPLRGSFLGLSLGALLFVLAATALGLLMSTFVRSQVAAIFGTAILCLIPSVNFSGLLYPVSTLTGSSYWVGVGFPSSWFQLISLGGFTKGLDWRGFLSMYAALAAFALAYIGAARLLLRKQEA
ncbi:ribosome-associated ATPase/putative transporter RbbA [Bordetella hinzii]|uniref:ABC transporter ATP-binding protein/permease n=1 Tax=Bordetella hinzii TaxID=103855 RepID=A0AAN1RWE4_9BORD|nr:ribosome-associated ATPase/putative transporter RbbA [Bordetella hinzii]AKQ61758.1 putative ABC transporter ATP-binding protein YbhF [Bordetella hinzii]AZW17298.1 ABC transporter ATP-binding protein/permease [Bordetella hinzii]KCB52020.1 putative ABC transporter, ATP-binding protein YhiH [Bordetella hinzii 1277]MBZ0074675.1 ribosome-associated ATPase/putative transporter RbbA [Bordetella hinzii]MBZ0079665.1 ribosome-associated ATPase/putative transporter RbbA [Bordetella hinzii]